VSTLANSGTRAFGPPVRPTQIPHPDPTALPPRLAALSHLAPAELARRFADAHAPGDLAAIDGEPICLALLPGGSRVARWAASDRCPWIGKTFHHEHPGRLIGHNRLRLLGGARALAFTANLGASLLDGRPSLIIRYDTPGNTNPWWQRRLHDELRELEPGLLAGPVAWLARRRPRTLCYFAIDLHTAGSP
jgi:hypothetical protein